MAKLEAPSTNLFRGWHLVLVVHDENVLAVGQLALAGELLDEILPQGVEDLVRDGDHRLQGGRVSRRVLGTLQSKTPMSCQV